MPKKGDRNGYNGAVAAENSDGVNAMSDIGNTERRAEGAPRRTGGAVTRRTT